MIYGYDMILYIHIPKTGGTSITKSFDVQQYHSKIITEKHPLYNKSPRFLHFQTEMMSFKISKTEHCRYVLGKELYNNVWKVAMVRNPWDRYVSNWKWLTRRESTYPKKGWKARGWQGEDGQISFEDFVKQMEWCYLDLDRLHAYQHDKWHLRNQIEHICDRGGNIMVDHVGRFENFQAEFDFICEKAGVTAKTYYLNHSGHYSAEPKQHNPKKTPYKDFYTQELIDIVAKRCKADIEAFNYDYN